ncbi:hypothetical protein WT56_00860 [Burkholderia pseudomultivorans]|uniref:3-hydroxyacyl-CoA dehydrogenase n=2 Tax=Burkholderia pseudomultivorans TaxID=1207504 RepID=A0A132ECA3_9BURK|nr:hypothetical protein WT56_00860 [Burkholderia pseudomultivorans]
MGRGIAQVCAAAGCHVRLFDSAGESIAQALNFIRNDLEVAVSKSKISKSDAANLLARIQPASGLHQLADCDLVVEAIVERIDTKQHLLRDLESIVGERCILATNTSSLSVTAIASVCRHAERVAGWHFFNPVPRMKIVEIVQTPLTAPAVVEALTSLSRRIGHHPIATTDSPGFVVNHAGRAFVTEGLKLLAERNAEHAVLDAILRNAGFRMGPFELLDLTGLDVSVPVMESIHAQYYGDARYRPVALARTRLFAGLLGRKSGQGFYRYTEPRSDTSLHASLAAPAETCSVWWQATGESALPESIAALLPRAERAPSPDLADLILLSPLRHDLATATADSGFDPSKTLAIDPLFSGTGGVTLMTSPATPASAVERAKSLFSAHGIPAFVIADSPGFVAPRVVACIINLACEMAQQGIATPADIDSAVRLGLGYPHGPFEWANRLGLDRVLAVLQGLYATFGDQRYRPSPWLVRRARLSLPVSAPDRQL